MHRAIKLNMAQELADYLKQAHLIEIDAIRLWLIAILVPRLRERRHTAGSLIKLGISASSQSLIQFFHR